MTWIMEHWVDILAAWGGLVAFCSAAVKLTPNTKDDAIWAKLLKFFDLFSVFLTKKDEKKLSK